MNIVVAILTRERISAIARIYETNTKYLVSIIPLKRKVTLQSQ